MKKLTHRQRIERTLAGEAVDRVPVALWRHFPVDDLDPHRLAEAVLAFQKLFDYDLVKVTPESTYFAREWGVENTWRGNPEGTRDYIRRPIFQPEEWEALTVLDPKKGSLGDQLACLRAVGTGLGPNTPMLETIFSPLGQARKLAGEERILEHMRRYPAALHTGLKIITESTLRFIEEIKLTGIAGIFYALQFARLAVITEEEYLAFGEPYHREILDAVSDLWLNVVHIHGNGILFDRAAALPVQVLNWHDRETEPGLAEALDRFPGVVCGGLRQWETMVYGTPDAVSAEALDAQESVGGRRFILGTGCVVPITAPYGNLVAARRSVEAA